MTELSPAARAVLEAVTWKKYDVPPEGLPAFAEEMAPLIAAALRAAANQIPYLSKNCSSYDVNVQDGREEVRGKFLAIASELDAR